MDIAAQFLQPFLLPNAEMLLLINDQQTQIVEADGFCQQRMCANRDLYITAGNIRLGPFGISRCRHARQHTDIDRKAGKSLLEQFAMLTRQQRCRCHQCNLIAAHRRDEGCT